MNNEGLAHRKLGAWNEAEKCHMLALELSQTLSEGASLANGQIAVDNLQSLLEGKNKHSSDHLARSGRQHFLAHLQHIKQPRLAAQSYGHLAQLCLSQGDAEEAEELFVKARENAEKANDRSLANLLGAQAGIARGKVKMKRVSESMLAERGKNIMAALQGLVVPGVAGGEAYSAMPQKKTEPPAWTSTAAIYRDNIDVRLPKGIAAMPPVGY